MTASVQSNTPEKRTPEYILCGRGTEISFFLSGAYLLAWELVG